MRRTSPLFTRYSMHTLFSNANFSHEKADRELGYTTRSLKETLRDTVAFLSGSGVRCQNACVCAAGLQTPRACCKLTLNQNHIQKWRPLLRSSVFFALFARARGLCYIPLYGRTGRQYEEARTCYEDINLQRGQHLLEISVVFHAGRGGARRRPDRARRRGRAAGLFTHGAGDGRAFRDEAFVALELRGRYPRVSG